jgi:hypothetical protein
MLQRDGMVMKMMKVLVMMVMMMMIPMKTSSMVMMMAMISPLREGVSPADFKRVSHHRKQKIPTNMNKNKPRSNLGDAKQRAREIRSTYPCSLHSGNI